MTNRIIYYYQTFNGLDKILYEGTPVTHIHLSAIHFGTNENGTPYIHLNDNPPDDKTFDSVWADMIKASKLGIKIILMVGGAGGAYYDLFQSYSIYYRLLYNLIKKHPEISGVDLDIEEYCHLDDVKKLINDLITDFGQDFIITTAPVSGSLESNTDGMGGFKYKDLYNSPEGQYIQYYNGQFYGSYSFSDWARVMNNDYPPHKIVMGMIYGQNLENALSTLKKVKQKYPNMGGAFIWEYINAPDGWANDVYNVFHNDDKKIENKEDNDTIDTKKNNSILGYILSWFR